MKKKIKPIATATLCTLALVGLSSTVGCGEDAEVDPNDSTDPANTPVPEPGTDGPDGANDGKEKPSN